MAKKKKSIDQIVKEKIKFLESLPDNFLNQTIGGAEAPLFSLLLEEFISALDVKEGRILSSAKNMRLVSAMDNIFKTWTDTQGVGIIRKHASNIGNIVDYNNEYYKEALGRSDEFLKGRKSIEAIINRRIGLNEDGSLIQKGYLKNLLDDPTVKNQVQEFAVKGVSQASGYDDFRRSFETLIKGNDETLGVLKKWHRNISYDIYKQVDGLQNDLFSKEFKLKYFIYDGTLIKTSRLFCKKRVGLVFSREEAEDWKNDPDLTARPLNYNPFTDIGGYACRHSLRFLTNEMAWELDPSRAGVI